MCVSSASPTFPLLTTPFAPPSQRYLQSPCLKTQDTPHLILPATYTPCHTFQHLYPERTTLLYLQRGARVPGRQCCCPSMP
jgi:hypothetical protein